MRLIRLLVLLSLSIVTVGCGVSVDTEEESVDEKNDAVAAKFRTTWANLDLAIAGKAGETTELCVRFTSLPGACQLAKRSFNETSDSGVLYSGPWDDTCDVGIQDSGVHIDLYCNAETFEHGCRGADFEGERRKADQTNSKKELAGDELAITGLGDQDWRVGSGLCTDIFAGAKKD